MVSIVGLHLAIMSAMFSSTQVFDIAQLMTGSQQSYCPTPLTPSCGTLFQKVYRREES